jgi:hypothetical protein
MTTMPLMAVALAAPAIALALVLVAGIFSTSAAMYADKVLGRLVQILRAWRG